MTDEMIKEGTEERPDREGANITIVPPRPVCNTHGGRAELFCARCLEWFCPECDPYHREECAHAGRNLG